MVKQRKVSCPLCGGQLLYCVKADSSLARKINKDGKQMKNYKNLLINRGLMIKR